MVKRKYRLKGHESFILRDGWLTKGIQAVEKDSGVFSKNSGTDVLGVGTNMAKAIRYWMRTAGITKDVPHPISDCFCHIGTDPKNVCTGVL